MVKVSAFFDFGCALAGRQGICHSQYRNLGFFLDGLLDQHLDPDFTEGIGCTRSSETGDYFVFSGDCIEGHKGVQKLV